MADKSKVVIVSLAILVIVLAVVVLYAFVIQPAIQGYNVQQQTTGAQQGIQYTVASIMQQVAQCQVVPLTYGNTTINIIAVDCLQRPAQ